MAIKKIIKAISDSKVFWGLVSLLCSLAIWTYVTSIQNDLYVRTFKGVRLEIIGEDTIRSSKNLVITDLHTNSVSIEISGPRRIIASLSESDLVAQIDVSKITQAAYTSLPFTVSFPNNIDKSNITVVYKNPDTVSFMISEQVSKNIQVRGSFNGNPAEGYSAEMPVFDPSYITVYGPEAYVKDVDYAWVTFGEDNISSTYSVDTGFVLMNKSGEECSYTGLTFSSETVNATLPILMVKDIPLTVELNYGAGANETNTIVEIEPKMITLAGDSSLLSGKNKIILGTINTLEMDYGYSTTYPIVVDDELRNLTGISEAKVTVQIVGLTTKTFKVIDIFDNITNTTEGYVATVQTESLDVVVRGSEQVLEQIQPENIRAVIDLKDFEISTGNYNVEATIIISGTSEEDAAAVGKYTLNIKIEKG